MCTWGWHITHCLQPLFTEARCTRSWECKAAWPPAFPHQQLPAFPPAVACSWNCTMQRHDTFSDARAGLLFTTSFSLLSWELDQLLPRASSQSSCVFCCPVFHIHTSNITKGVLKSVRNFLWPSIPFSDGFGLVLLWPENVHQSIQQPPHPWRSAFCPAA